MSTHTVQQFLTAVKTVAFKAETFSECSQLIEWFGANVPYVEPVEPEFMLVRQLDDLTRHWNNVGCAEDEIMPALAILYTYAAHGYLTQHELYGLQDRQARCNWMVSHPNMDEDWTSYEEFCDKYAAELNH